MERSRRGLPIWLFVLLILVFAGAFSWQYRLASGLEVQVANLEAKLVAANSLVGAHQGRLREIRGGVRDLATQIESLKALVDADPTSGAPNPSLPATSSRSEGSRRLDATRSNPSPRDPILDIPARLPQ